MSQINESTETLFNYLFEKSKNGTEEVCFPENDRFEYANNNEVTKSYVDKMLKALKDANMIVSTRKNCFAISPKVKSMTYNETVEDGYKIVTVTYKEKIEEDGLS